MLWNLEKSGTWWYDILPWFERSTSWGNKYRDESVYYRIYTIEWIGWKLEAVKEITFEKWLKIKRKNNA